MADMLKFRRGTYAQINAAPLANGTIYIATNEKAMYVDTATERIRIGDFIRVDTVKDITPPYSTSSLYYVEADNALLKYDGTNWKQVNGTDDIRTELSGVKGEVATLKSTVGNAESGLVKDVNDLKTAVGNADAGLVADVAANAKDIEDLKAAVGMGDDGTADGIGATVIQLGKDLDDLELEVHGENGNGGIVGTLNDYGVRITAVEGYGTSKADKTYVDNTFVTKEAANPILAKVDTEGTVTAAINAAVAVEKSRAEDAEKALSEELSAVKNTADSAVLKTTFEQFKTDNTTAINTAKTSAVSEATTAANSYTDSEIAKEVTRANGAYAPKSLADEVATQATTLTTLTGEASVPGSVAEAKKAAEDAATLASQKTTLDEVKGLNYATKTEAQGYANAKDAAIQAAADAAAGAKSAADDAQEAADAAQGDATKALNAIGDANSGLTKTVNANTAAIEILNGADSVNGSVANAKKAGTDAQATANANAGEIATLKSAVGTAKKGTGDGTAGNEAATGLYKVIEDSNKTLKTELSAEIDADIRAANAMEYVATIDSASKLPTTAKNGATYVVGSAFGSYAAGDMLIAQGTEDPDTGLITNPTWAHVKSGYDATLNQQITGSDNKIMLSDGTKSDADAGGAISFVATGSASVSVADNTVTIGTVWDDFT